jgi:hypothetical protein
MCQTLADAAKTMLNDADFLVQVGEKERHQSLGIRVFTHQQTGPGLALKLQAGCVYHNRDKQ